MHLLILGRPLPQIRLLLCFLWLAFSLSLEVSLAAEASDDGPRHQLNRVTDTLYQFTDGDNAGVVLLSDAGAVVIDPMNSETAQWLQNELNNRFRQDTGYVIYSSTLQDRIGGAEVFARQGATIIAHENAAAFFQTEKTLPSPDILFSKKLSLQLSSTTADLHFFGKSLTDSNIVIHFPTEQAMYAGNIVAVEAFPVVDKTVLANAYIPDWFTTINRMNRIDFIYLLTAQDKIGIQHDGVQHGHFLRELHHRVRQSLASAESDDVAASNAESPPLAMDNYRRWDHQDQLPNLVSGLKQVILPD